MTKFSNSNSLWRPFRDDAIAPHDRLPGGYYLIKQDPFKEFYLETQEPFTLPPRLYGTINAKTNRIIKTFYARPTTTGVLLAGEKGSGKTLLAKNICARLVADGVPVLISSSPFAGDTFNAFISCIEQPTVIMFDEFEKVYDRESQQQLLTLLDGTFTSKKLFLLTCNDEFRVDEHMRNRPGRIFYFIPFGGLEPEFVQEYAEENLINKEHIGRVVSLAGLYHSLSFDMLQGIVEEMNRYNEDPAEALLLLNARPDLGGGAEYKLAIWVNDEAVDTERLEDLTLQVVPLGSKGVSASFQIEREDEDGDKVWRWQNVHVDHTNLSNFDSMKGQYTFVKGDIRVMLTRVAREKRYDYKAF